MKTIKLTKEEIDFISNGMNNSICYYDRKIPNNEFNKEEMINDIRICEDILKKLENAKET